MGSYHVWWPRSMRVNWLLASQQEKSMWVNGSVNSPNCVCRTSARRSASAVESAECSMRDANGIISMAVGSSPWLFTISETVDKFSRSERVQLCRGERGLFHQRIFIKTLFIISLKEGYLLMLSCRWNSSRLGCDRMKVSLKISTPLFSKVSITESLNVEKV